MRPEARTACRRLTRCALATVPSRPKVDDHALARREHDCHQVAVRDARALAQVVGHGQAAPRRVCHGLGESGRVEGASHVHGKAAHGQHPPGHDACNNQSLESELTRVTIGLWSSCSHTWPPSSAWPSWIGSSSAWPAALWQPFFGLPEPTQGSSGSLTHMAGGFQTRSESKTPADSAAASGEPKRTPRTASGLIPRPPAEAGGRRRRPALPGWGRRGSRSPPVATRGTP